MESAWTTADLTPKNYNPSRPPQLNESQPLEVKLDLKVLSILGISEVEQSFTGTKSSVPVSVYFIQADALSSSGCDLQVVLDGLSAEIARIPH